MTFHLSNIGGRKRKGCVRENAPFSFFMASFRSYARQRPRRDKLRFTGFKKPLEEQCVQY